MKRTKSVFFTSEKDRQERKQKFFPMNTAVCATWNSSTNLANWSVWTKLTHAEHISVVLKSVERTESLHTCGKTMSCKWYFMLPLWCQQNQAIRHAPIKNVILETIMLLLFTTTAERTIRWIPFGYNTLSINGTREKQDFLLIWIGLFRVNSIMHVWL